MPALGFWAGGHSAPSTGQMRRIVVYRSHVLMARATQGHGRGGWKQREPAGAVGEGCVGTGGRGAPPLPQGGPAVFVGTMSQASGAFEGHSPLRDSGSWAPSGKGDLSMEARGGAGRDGS